MLSDWAWLGPEAQMVFHPLGLAFSCVGFILQMASLMQLDTMAATVLGFLSFQALAATGGRETPFPPSESILKS